MLQAIDMAAETSDTPFAAIKVNYFLINHRSLEKKKLNLMIKKRLLHWENLLF